MFSKDNPDAECVDFVLSGMQVTNHLKGIAEKEGMQVTHQRMPSTYTPRVSVWKHLHLKVMPGQQVKTLFGVH